MPWGDGPGKGGLESWGPADLDLNLEDFVNRVNAELVNKITNLMSRVVPFVVRAQRSRRHTTSPLGGGWGDAGAALHLS